MGFIGSNFIRYMLSTHRDLQVVNIDKLSYGASPANLKPNERDRRYSFARGDINNQELLARQVRDIDVMVNFAAESHVDRSIANPWPFVRSNIDGTLSILEAIRRNPGETKLIQVSTDEVYGDVQNGSVDEGAKLAPSSPYAVSKAAADMLCLAYRKTYGLNLSITRCTNNFGPNQFPEKLIPKTIIRARKNLGVPVYGRGKNVRDWIYVTDHCQALNLVVESGKAGEVYNIAGHNELETGTLVKDILKIMGSRSHVEFVDDRPGHDLRYSLDDRKIRHELGWKPRYSLRNALEDTVNWYLRNVQWWQPLASKKVLGPSPWKNKW